MLGFVLTSAKFFLLVSALTLNSTQPRAGCTVTSYSEVNDALSSCTNIVINGLTVPAGETLTLTLQRGSTLTFEGTTKFEYKEWTGPLVLIQGDAIIVQGAKGSVLDGQGPLYWDGLGGNGGRTKPKFIKISASDGSEITNINVLNCPVHCVSIGNSHGLTISGWEIDVSAGDIGGGHNTDGFDISSSSNVVLKDSIVRNQDDCVAVNQGSDFTFSGLYCSGSHGLSLSVGMSLTSPEANTVTNVVFSNCTVVNSENGIHVKTHTYATTGYVKNVTYRNIILSGISNYGINIQEDYDNGGATGIPRDNIPVTDLKLIDVRGTVASNAMPVYILCGENGCADWTWSGVSVSGGSKSSSCNFTPNGYTC